MLKRKVITILFIAMLTLAACSPKASPASEDISSPEATSSAQATSSPEATSSTLTATLTELVGTVDVKHAGQDSFVTASTYAVLEVQGQIQTGDDGRVRLDLSSGTIIRVAPSSLFTLASNEEVEGGLATKIKLELGKIFIILNGGNAEVETPSGVASVRGSFMMVKDGYATCLEGNCSVTTPAGTVNFTTGQRVTFTDCDSNCTLPTVENMTAEDYQEWLDANPEVEDLVNEVSAGGGTGGSSGDSQDACFEITEPLASSQQHQGKVKFAWESLPGAEKYIVTFTDANGNVVAFETNDTSIEKYVEGFIPGAGDYSWAVTAYGEDGSEICKTETETFSKPDSNAQPRHPDRGGDDTPGCDICDPQSSCYDMYMCGG